MPFCFRRHNTNCSRETGSLHDFPPVVYTLPRQPSGCAPPVYRTGNSYRRDDTFHGIAWADSCRLDGTHLTNRPAPDRSAAPRQTNARAIHGLGIAAALTEPNLIEG
jgi:hypothetical protein